MAIIVRTMTADIEDWLPAALRCSYANHYIEGLRNELRLVRGAH
jgi:hypothetical protein